MRFNGVKTVSIIYKIYPIVLIVRLYSLVEKVNFSLSQRYIP